MTGKVFDEFVVGKNFCSYICEAICCCCYKKKNLQRKQEMLIKTQNILQAQRIQEDSTEGNSTDRIDLGV